MCELVHIMGDSLARGRTRLLRTIVADLTHQVRRSVSSQRFPEARRLTAEDIEALDMLTELAGDPDLQLNMNFIPGDIQFLHNHTILHARSAYEDWPEAERKRHLLRLWLSPPGARPLPPVFAECYGGITIGDRGGIVCKGTRLHVPLTPG
jgi:hypothetical protein